MAEIKLLFADTETTGVDPQLNHIHQISGIITDPDNSEVFEEFDLKFVPYDVENVSPEALTKCGLTFEELKGRQMTSYEAWVKFVDILSKYVDRYNSKDKMQFVAYNARFDTDFVRAWFKVHGDNYYGSWFWHPPICVMMEAAWQLKKKRDSFKSFRLEDLCGAAGITFDEAMAHDALYDIQKTRELYTFLDE